MFCLQSNYSEANRVAGRIDLPAPTLPDVRVRVRQFLAVLADQSALFLCHAGSWPGSTVRLQRQPASSYGRTACQVQPFPSCESIRYLRAGSLFPVASKISRTKNFICTLSRGPQLKVSP